MNKLALLLLIFNSAMVLASEHHSLFKKPDRPLNECRICSHVQKDIALLQCQHSFCEPCILKHIEQNLEDRNLINCPDHRCGAQVPYEHIKEFLQKFFDADRVQEQLNTYTKIFVDHHPEYRYCPHDQVTLGKRIENSWVSNCPSCNIVHCFVCGEVHSPRKTCLEADTQLYKMYTDAYMQLKQVGKKPIWKICPICGAMQERIKGCDFMRCGQHEDGEKIKSGHGCGARFNWNLAEIFKEPENVEADIEAHEGTPLINNRTVLRERNHDLSSGSWCPNRSQVRNFLSLGTVSIILSLNFIRGMYVLIAVPEIPTDEMKTLTEYRRDCDLCAAVSTQNCIDNKIDFALGSKWSEFDELLNRREDFFVFLTLADVLIPAIIGPFGPLCTNSMTFSSVAFASSLVSLPFEIKSLSYSHQPAKNSLVDDFKLNSEEYSNLHNNATLIHLTQDSAEEIISSLDRLDAFTEGPFKHSIYVLRSLQLSVILAKFLI